MPASRPVTRAERTKYASRSEEHTSELQSQSNLVCRLLLEKKNLRGPGRQREPPGLHEDLRLRRGVGCCDCNQRAAAAFDHVAGFDALRATGLTPRWWPLS